MFMSYSCRIQQAANESRLCSCITAMRTYYSKRSYTQLSDWRPYAKSRRHEKTRSQMNTQSRLSFAACWMQHEYGIKIIDIFMYANIYIE